MRRRVLRRETAVYLLTVAVLVLIGLNADRFALRLDLTEHNVYSIAPVSRELVRELPTTAQISYYVSPELRRLSGAPERIEELLEEYAAYGGGGIHLQTLAPEQAGVSREIDELGLEPRQVQVMEQNEQRYIRVYSGIVIRYQGRSRVIPFILDPGALEYELTSALFRLRKRERPRLTLLVGREDRSAEEDYRLLSRSLREHFRLRIAESGRGIGEETDVLLLIGGADLGRETLRRVDAYLSGGGALLVMMEGVRVSTEEALEAQKVSESPFTRMMARYGVRVERALVLDEYHRDFRIPHRTGGGTAWESLGGYPYWVSIREASVSTEHPVTARFPGLDLLWASPLRLVPGEGVQAQELVRSSTRAWTVREDFRLEPTEEITAPAGGRRQEPLAAVLRGSFPRVFLPAGAEDAAVQEQENGPGRMVVFGDTDFAADLLHYSGSYYNLEMLVNCCQWLAGEEELMELRTRRSRDLRLNDLDPPRERAQYRLAQVISIAVVPAAVALFGLLRFRRRRRQGSTGGQE